MIIPNFETHPYIPPYTFLHIWIFVGKLAGHIGNIPYLPFGEHGTKIHLSSDQFQPLFLGGIWSSFFSLGWEMVSFLGLGMINFCGSLKYSSAESYVSKIYEDF